MTTVRAKPSAARATPSPEPVALVHAAYDLLEQGMGVFDRDLKLVACNKQFRKLRGYPAKLCRPGTPIVDLVRHNAEQGRYGIDDVAGQVDAWVARVEAFEHYETETELADGRTMAICIEPIGQRDGLLVVYADVTDARTAARALEESEARHKLVEDAALEGIYEWDIEKGDLFASPRLKQLFGFTPSEIGPQNWDWKNRVHPEDFERYRAALVIHFKGDGEHYQCEYRVRNKAGDYRWVLDRGVSVKNEAGRAVRLIGAITDISKHKEIEATLRESEERYALAMQAINEGVYDWNIESGETYYSPRIHAVLGLPRKALRTTHDWLGLIHPDDLQAYKDALAAHFKGKTKRFEWEYRYRGKDGAWRWAQQHGIALRNEAGRAYRMAGSTGDITERKRAEEALRISRDEAERALAELKEAQEALRESEERYALVAQAASEGLYDYDVANNWLYVSPRLNEIFGFEDAERLRSEKWYERVHSDDAERYRRTMVAHFKGESDRLVCEYRIRDKTGGYRWIADHGIAIRSEGRTVRLVGAVSDITELKHQQDVARQSQQQLAAAIDSISEGFVIYDPEDRLVLRNDQYRALYPGLDDVLIPGTRHEEVLRAIVERGKFAGAVDDTESWVAERQQKHLNPGDPYEQELADGRWAKVAWRKTEDGGIVGVFTDITELKEAEFALRESEERHALALVGANEGLWDWNLDTGQIYVSPRIVELLDLDADGDGHISSEYWSTRIHPDDLPVFQDAIRAHLRGETEFYTCEFRALNPAGEYIWISHRGLGERGEDGRVYRMTGSTGDITARKEAELELERAHKEAAAAQQRLTDAIESLSEGFVFFDADDRVVQFNSRYRQYFVDAAGEDVADLVVPGVAFWDLVRAAHKKSMFPDIKGEDLDDYIIARIERRRRTHSTVEQHLADGRWLQINERQTSDGGVASVYTDITELKHRENELAAARDQAMAATQAKSRFLANMSHELRTPLNAVIGITEMLEEDAKDLGQDDFIEPLERIEGAGRHLLHLINEVLDLSKIEAGKLEFHFEDVDIPSMVRDLQMTAQPLADKNGNNLVMQCPPDVGAIRSDLTRVRQILLNLLSNACKFTENGDITMEVSREVANGEDRLRVSVADTGIGMTEEQMENLFEEFMQADSSTTRKYGGTGLGLAISQRLANMLRGAIAVDSTPNVGTTFTLTLPLDVSEIPSSAAATAEAARQQPAAIPRRDLDRTGDTVLVVDDDPTVLDLMRKFLAREGRDVVTARGGEQGLELARQVQPSAIILDVLMPGMDGWTVLQELKADPELAGIPVIMQTIVDEKNKGFSLGAAEYLTKPIDRQQMQALLEKYSHRKEGGQALVVEDDPAIRELLSRVLKEEGWRVEKAANGLAAIAAVARNTPDLILLDLIMPEMDGFDFLEQLRQTPDLRHIPVIVVTAADLSEEDRQRLNSGVERVLHKSPHDENALLTELRELVDTYAKVGPAGRLNDG